MYQLHQRIRMASILGAIATFALAGTPALSTPGSGLTGGPIARGEFSALDINAEKLGHWDLKVKAKGETDLLVSRLTFAAGGQSGWHTHPGPGLIMVTSGSVVVFDGHNPLCTSRTYQTGDTFIDEGGDEVHLVRNASASSTAEMIVVSFFPEGSGGRIDAQKPTNCPG